MIASLQLLEASRAKVSSFRVQEKEHVVKDLNAKIATLRQEVKQYQDSRKEEVEKSQLVLELQSHLNDANEQVSELKQMLERTGEALLEKDVHIQKLRAALDEEEICTKKQVVKERSYTQSRSVYIIHMTLLSFFHCIFLVPPLLAFHPPRSRISWNFSLERGAE